MESFVETTSDTRKAQPPHSPVVHHNSATISLACLLEIVTACAIFFACLKFSPPLAILGAIIVAPAILRTGFLSELSRRNGEKFNWKTRSYYFSESVIVVMLTGMIGLAVFALISLLFGLMGAVLSIMADSTELIADAAVVGTAGGMIWGVAGALLAMAVLVVKTWVPRQFREIV